MRRGFSLLEVLLATFILGIGLVMVAAVFPVGANWTRESTESSVGQTIALNAVATIQAHYAPNSRDTNHANRLATLNTTTPLKTLPNFVGANGIPITERCYQFGSSSPFPAQNASACLYYWSALGRATPSGSHDIFIFVFRKGEATQTFTQTASMVSGSADDSSASPPPYFLSNTGAQVYFATSEPILVSQPYSVGTWNATRQTIDGAFPPVGYYGVGVTTGTVFTQTVNFKTTPPSASANPLLLGQVNPSSAVTENIIYAPAADGIAGSPLIYVYQTTLPY